MLKKIIIILIILFGFTGMLYAENSVESLGREVKNKNEKAVIKVNIVVKQKVTIQGREVNKQESKFAVNGVIIDSTGLIAISLITTEPSSLYMNMLEGTAAAGQDFKMESEITDIKIRLNNGQEIPGKIIIRDKDLDLSIVQPADKISEISFVNINDNVQPQVMDECFLLMQLGKIGNWNVAVTTTRIGAVIQKPRTIYEAPVTGLGFPVFSANGKFIGLTVLRTLPSSYQSSNNPIAWLTGDIGFSPMILPAGDIIDLVKQINTSAEDTNKPKE